MPLEAAEDSGQKMPAPTGRAVGFIDPKAAQTKLNPI